MITLLNVVYLSLAILIIILVLMQKSKNSGFSSAIGGAGVIDSHYNKNKSKTFEGKLEIITRWLIILFILMSIVINVVINSRKPSDDTWKNNNQKTVDVQNNANTDNNTEVNKETEDNTQNINESNNDNNTQE